MKSLIVSLDHSKHIQLVDSLLAKGVTVKHVDNEDVVVTTARLSKLDESITVPLSTFYLDNLRGLPITRNKIKVRESSKIKEIIKAHGGSALGWYINETSMRYDALIDANADRLDSSSFILGKELVVEINNLNKSINARMMALGRTQAILIENKITNIQKEQILRDEYLDS